MGFEIKDGTGKGFAVGVTSNNRLLTSTVNESIFANAAETGDAYFVGTPTLTLTNAAESALFFIKNNEDDKLIFENFFSTANATTGATQQIYTVNWYKNPTSISTVTATTPLNQNFGSSNTLLATTIYGAQGATFTGGTLVASLVLPIAEFNQIPANLVLPKGSSFGVSITPPAGNTSLPVQFGGRSVVYRELY